MLLHVQDLEYVAETEGINDPPKYATDGSAGFDIQSMVSYVLKPGEIYSVYTGLRLNIPEGYEVQIRPRSGLAAKHGIGMVNAPGTIDSDYTGVIHVILINFSNKEFHIEKGDRIAQAILSPVVRVNNFKKVHKLNKITIRGEGGFGHTGVK